MKRRRGSELFRGRVAAGAAAVLLTVLLGAQALAAGPSMMAGFPLRAGANVMLMWMPFPGATLYNVYRGEAPGGPYKKVAEVPMNMHTDMNVPTDKSYYYVVKAVVGGKEGDPSSEAAMKGLEPMVTPKFIGDLITPDNKLALRWEANPKAAFYNLYRSLTETGEYALLSSVQDSKYTDGTVELGKTYHYKVTSVSSANVESPKADKPLTVKVEKKDAAGEEKAAAMVQIPVKENNTYDVDGDVILRAPRDLELLPGGNLLVVDERNFAHVVDKDMKFQKYLGKRPDDYKDDWGFLSGLHYAPATKELYLCFSTANIIRVYDLEGRLLRTLSLGRPDPKVAPDQSFRPMPNDAFLGADGTLWVVDGAYYMVVGIDSKTGKEIKRATGLGRFHPDRNKPEDKSIITPGSMAGNNKTGTIYVIEGSGQRVTAYNKAGDFLFRFGGRGGGPGKFQVPVAIGVNQDDGTVYVGDRNTSVIQAFDQDGKYKGTLVFPKKEDPGAKVRTGNGVTGLAAAGKQVFYTDTVKERLVVFDILPATP